jgi:predicted transcriptional regulator
MTEDNNLRDLVAEVAAAYFSNSHTSASDIPTVIQQIASSLAAVGAGPLVNEPAPEIAPVEEPPKRLTPAQIRKSITPDGLISFEDGKPYKTLKRHLGVRGMTIAEYKAKWGLPKDYPAVAPSYSAQRSQLARSIGLGQAVKAPPPAPKPPAKRRTKASASS